MRIVCMFGVVDLPTYLLALAVVILLPGPNSLLVLATASRSGTRAGFGAAAGVWTGDVVLMALAVGGVASLLQTRPTLFAGLQVVGALYLAWMGIILIASGWSGWGTKPNEREQGSVEQGSGPRGPRAAVVTPFSAYRRSLAVSLVNPKAIIFFVAFFSQFVDPDYPYPWLSFVLLGLCVQVFSTLYLSAVVLSGARMASSAQRRPRMMAGATAGAGVLFLWFAISLGSAAVGVSLTAGLVAS